MMINRKLRSSLLFKVALTVTLAVTSLAGALVYFYGRQMLRDADEALDRRVEAVALGLANQCEYGLLVGNRSLLQQAAQKVLTQADIISVVVFDENGKLMAAAGHVDLAAKAKAGPQLVARYQKFVILVEDDAQATDALYEPVFLQPSSFEASVDGGGEAVSTEVGRQLGLIEMRFSDASTFRAVQRTRLIAVLITALSALAVSLFSVYGMRKAILPLRKLVAGTEALAAGNLDVRVTVASADEIGDLANAFNKMAGALQLSQKQILDHQRDLEQRVAERTAELRESELGFKRMFASNPLSMMVFDRQTLQFLEVNAAAVEHYGYSREEFLKLTIADIRPVEDLPKLKKYLAATRPESRDAGEWRHCRKNGEIIDVHILSHPLDLPGRDAVLVVAEDITQRKRAEQQLEDSHRKLLEVSRQAGMAEVSTNVLHNVGNVLNSVNVTTLLLTDKVRASKVANCAKAAALIRAHSEDLGEFLTNDVKGRQLPGYLADLGQNLIDERAEILKELESLGNNVEHIKEIVAMQQNYAKVAGVRENVSLVELVEDAIRLNAQAFSRHGVEIVRDFAPVPSCSLERHKVLQILINLLRNAKYAVDENAAASRQITVRVWPGADDTVSVAVLDNGVGIPPENLTKIFSHGFTTRKEGHGFGLHSGVLAAREMGGSLSAHSDGLGKGAVFTLELPRERAGNGAEDGSL